MPGAPRDKLLAKALTETASPVAAATLAQLIRPTGASGRQWLAASGGRQCAAMEASGHLLRCGQAIRVATSCWHPCAPTKNALRSAGHCPFLAEQSRWRLPPDQGAHARIWPGLMPRAA